MDQLNSFTLHRLSAVPSDPQLSSNESALWMDKSGVLHNTWGQQTPGAGVVDHIIDFGLDTTVAYTLATAGADLLTFSGQPGDTETFTIGTKVYTWQTTLTNVDGHIAIGTSVANSIINARAAITLGTGGGGAGTAYAAATTLNAAPITFASVVLNGTTAITMTSTSGLLPGMLVTGTGITAGTTVASVTSTTAAVLSAAATAGTITMSSTIGVLAQLTATTLTVTALSGGTAPNTIAVAETMANAVWTTSTTLFTAGVATLGSAAVAQTIVPVPGALPDDVAVASLDVLDGLAIQMSANVSNPGYVTVTFVNQTGATQTLGAGNLHVRVTH